MGDALGPDALDPGMFQVVDVGLLEGRVVEEDLNAVRAGFFQAVNRPVVQKVGQAARRGRVVACLLVGEQEAGTVAQLSRR